LLIGEREDMELVVEVDLVAVGVRWLSLEDGRGLLVEDAGLSIRDVLMAVVVGRLTSRDVGEAMVGEAEGGLLIGEKEEMELVVEVGLVAVGVRWLSVDDGRWLLEEDAALSLLLMRNVLATVGLRILFKKLANADVGEAAAAGAEGRLLIGEREEMELVIEVDLVAVGVRWLSLDDGRWLLVEDAGLTILLVGDVLMAVRVERLTSEDVGEAMAGEAEGGLLIGEREEVGLVVEVDLVAVDVRWLVLDDGWWLLVEGAGLLVFEGEGSWLFLGGGRWFVAEDVALLLLLLVGGGLLEGAGGLLLLWSLSVSWE
jgi:hypothetical protein